MNQKFKNVISSQCLCNDDFGKTWILMFEENCRHEPVSITCRMRKPCYGRVQFVLCLLENKKIDLSRIPVNKGTNTRLGWTKYNISYENRPFTANHVVQNRHAGEEKSHWDKTNKGNYHLELCMPLFVLSHCDFKLSSIAVCTTWMASCKRPIHPRSLDLISLCLLTGAEGGKGL